RTRRALTETRDLPSAGRSGASPSSSKIAIRALLYRRRDLATAHKAWRGGLAAPPTRSARHETECPQRHHHDRAGDHAPAAGDGTPDRKREKINPFRCHEPHPDVPTRSFAHREAARHNILNEGLIS